MKVMIATGGTGGHIYPALALANSLKDSSNEIIFVGSNDRMEAQLIPEKGYEFIGLSMSGMNGSIIDKAKSAVLLLKATNACKKILKSYKPDIVVGFGNYISVPLIMAANKMKITTMIHEQNSFPGKANLMLSKYSEAIVCCYQENLNQFPVSKTKLLGNPEASFAALQTKDDAMIRSFGLDPNIPLVVIMMGSLGSKSVNEVLDNSCSLFSDTYQVLIVSGKNGDHNFKSKDTDTVKIVPYVDGAKMMASSDLLVVRGGATTAAEITAIGVASIIIPSPYVPNNHQFINAEALVQKGAAQMIEEKNLSPNILVNMINDLMQHKEKRDAIANNARALGKPNACKDMIQWMEELVK